MPSWRPGPTRDSVIAFLDASEALPRTARVACFDNDGTLWCEKPNYVQWEFFVKALKDRVASEPSVVDRAEYAALINGDRAAIGELGLAQIAVALTELFEGIEPELFAAESAAFVKSAVHPTLGVPLGRTIYAPMLELIGELRAREFTVAVVTGGGAEFVRAVADDLYGVPQELVVGTLIEYDFRKQDGGPSLARSSRLVGGANEGPVKVNNIQTQLGRRPILAAGNSDGDSEMMQWATTGDGPSLALLVDHDDATREFEYSGHSATLGDDREPIRDTAARLEWTVVSMAHDWTRVFPGEQASVHP